MTPQISFYIIIGHRSPSNTPHNLLPVPLLFLLGCDLGLETANLSVQTLGCPSNLYALWTDSGGLGDGCLNQRVKQILSKYC